MYQTCMFCKKPLGSNEVELVLHRTLLEARGGEHGYPHQGLLVRRGPEDSWSPMPTPTPRWTSLRAARYRFTPASAITDGIGELRYHLEAKREDERYTPDTYGPVFQVPAQFAQFLEDDSLVVVAAAHLDGAQLVAPRTVFLVSDGPGSFPVFLEAPAHTTRPVFEAVVPQAPMAVSVESLDERRAAARARTGLLPLETDGIVLSDPLLVLPSRLDLPDSHEEAVARMLGTTAIGADDELAVYWEVYGVRADWPLQVKLSVEGERPGFLTRALRALRIRAAPRMPEVAWEQTVAVKTEPMAMNVDIRNLADGEYTLKIEVAGPYGLVATGERQFSVERPQ